MHILMARILVRTVSSCACTKGFRFVPLAVCGQRLIVSDGIHQAAGVTVSQANYVPSTHILLSARRSYKTTHKLSHLTVEEQFILRVSSTVYCLYDYFALIVCFYLRLNDRSSQY